MSKRVKVTFQSVNAGKIGVIDSKQLAASSHRIKAVMQVVVRAYKTKEAQSMQDARRLVLNA